jgi:hypothetical protein
MGLTRAPEKTFGAERFVLTIAFVPQQLLTVRFRP